MARTACSKCGATLDGRNAYYCLACCRLWSRAHYDRHREAEIARASAYNRAHPDVPARAMRKVRAKDPALSRKKLVAWRTANPDRVRVYDATKRAKRRGAVGDDRIGPDEWLLIQRLHGDRCAYCGAGGLLTQDHYVPLAAGGRHSIGNVLPACRSCNSSKQARTGAKLTEWLEERGASETAILHEIMLAASDRGHRLARNNIGVATYGTGKRKSTVRYGVFGPGAPDLIGWTKDGEFCGIEVKRPGERAKEHQERWHAAAKRSCPTLRIGVAHSVAEAISILED